MTCSLILRIAPFGGLNPPCVAESNIPDEEICYGFTDQISVERS